MYADKVAHVIGRDLFLSLYRAPWSLRASAASFCCLLILAAASGPLVLVHRAVGAVVAMLVCVLRAAVATSAPLTTKTINYIVRAYSVAWALRS